MSEGLDKFSDFGTGRINAPESIRQAAESTLSQARQTVDQYLREATRLHDAVEASGETAQSGLREVNQKVIGFAKKNVDTAFAFALRLVHATDLKELAQLQQEFLRMQVEEMNSQMRELGEHSAQTVKSAGAAARP